MMPEKRIVIGVMGGSNVSAQTSRLAQELGAGIAQAGWLLLTGGRNAGVMREASRGAAEAGGTVLGILPGECREQANPWVHIPILTGMGQARNVINVLSCEVLVALPGKGGTLSEIALAMKFERPLLLLGWDKAPFDDVPCKCTVTEALTWIQEQLSEQKQDTP